MLRGRSDDKDTMASRLISLVALGAFASTVLLVTTSSAGASLVAPPAVCPNQVDASVSPAAQEEAMRCLTGFARSRAGLRELSDVDQLDLSAREKGADVLRCNVFSHTACGREFTYWFRETGYTSEACWRVGENLAWGIGSYGSVRSIFQAWLRSPAHRRNILGDYEALGLSRQVGELEGHASTIVWTAHFGSHCGAAVDAV
jgi:uncharacterized protein YkwD